jgi:hypothetical protein
MKQSEVRGYILFALPRKISEKSINAEFVTVKVGNKAVEAHNKCM